MPSPPDVAELPLTAAPEQVEDPDFEALPTPRRPGKRVTLAALALTALVALLLAFSLRSEAVYALQGGSPTDVGELNELSPAPELANTWIRGQAELQTEGAIRYSRPLDSDSFRLAPVAGNPGLWVELRVPEGLEGPRFVPPASFVGRLVPLSRAGLRHGGLPGSVAEVTGARLPDDAWLLVDGETPSSTRWALGLVALFLGFAAFSVYGLVRLLRPVRG